tara:strand:+ start:1372 stop:2553 length:1182 start_codon:yes stop_codon:yes gene_type:complete
MSYLLANGCSYTDANFGSSTGEYVHTNEEKDKLGIPRSNWKMWPEYVAEKFKLPHVNLGDSGGSNFRMCTTSMEQILKEKPKILMHLWSSSGRFKYYEQKYHDSQFTSAVFYAAELLNRNGYVFLEEGAKTGLNRKNAQFGFQAIKLFYPEKLEETFKFYESFHDDDEWILQLLLDCRKKIIDVNELPEPTGPMARIMQPTLMKTWIQYINSRTEADRNTCIKTADNIITAELQPILQTYYMANAENIPFVSIFGQEISPFQISLNFSKKLKPYKNIIKAAGRHQRKFSNLIDKDNLNKFDIIVLFNQYLHQIARENLINNFVFKKLDDLIAEKKFITKCWPPFPPYGLNNHDIEKCITKNWKELSDADKHPDPNTQKYIGDAFYDLYQKNYS